METQNQNTSRQNKKIFIITASIILAVTLVVAAFMINTDDGKEPTMVVEQEPKEEQNEFVPPPNASPITALPCDNRDKRAFAVMYSGSLDARPFWKNLSEADFILEMPHRMHDEPRLMGVFQCNTPDAIGPMRSGRVDHMAVADAMGAVFVTWGKSIVAAAAMNRGLADNLEVGNGTASQDGTRSGFIDPEIHFYSANSAYADLNGVIKESREKGYSSENLFGGFPHQGDIPMEERPSYGKVRVKFDDNKYLVEYFYDKETNSYKRFRQDAPVYDYATNKQYSPKNLVTIITKRDGWIAEKDYKTEGLLDPWQGVPEKKVESNQYPNMQLGDPWFDTKFEGEAEFFLNGKHIHGTWKREKGRGNPFQFFDEDGKELRFVPGQIWMHVLSHDKNISYEDEEERQERLEEENENE